MITSRLRIPGLLMLLLLGIIGSSGLTAAPARSESSLDRFMADVLARRDENWRKLQQYVLDEHEVAEVLGPGRTRLYGMVRDYAWYIRDGTFIRSPIRYDGVTLSEAERLKYEQEWITREKNRDKPKHDATAAAEPTAPAAPADPGQLAQLAREPQFVSAAYFLRFKFEPGHYAFAGRETLDGREVYRIEYYPERLFNSDHDEDDPVGADQKKADTTDGKQGAQRDGKQGGKKEGSQGESDEDQRFERQMNKVALITLWVEPKDHQILQYTFDNIGFDFMPARWLVRIDTIHASMRMGEAFPNVWLPRQIEGKGDASLATGSFEVRYRTSYLNYREAETKGRLR
jgi:hypothetical protein